MEPNSIDRTLRRVQDRLIDSARQRGAELTPWFEANGSKVTLLARLLASVADGSPGATPETILQTTQALVESKLNAQSSWFAQNLPLLRLITKELLTAPQALEGNAPAPQPDVPIFEVVPFSEKYEPPSPTIAGNEQAIADYLSALGLSPAMASELARSTDPDDLNDKIQQRFLDQTRRQNTALRGYAAEANKAKNRADTLSAPLGESLTDSARSQIESALNQAAAESVGAVAGFLAYLRTKKPFAVQTVEEILAPLGALSGDWNTRILADGAVQSIAESELADQMRSARVEADDRPGPESPAQQLSFFRATKVADKINQLNSSNEPLSPSAALSALPPHATKQEFSRAVADLLRRASVHSETAVSGLLLFARTFRPDVAAELSALIEPIDHHIKELGDAPTIAGGWDDVRRLRVKLPTVQQRGSRSAILLGSAIAKRMLLIERAQELDSEVSDLRTAAQRTSANIAAINILARGEAPTPGELAKLEQYSGWGGLSIQAIQNRVPEGWVPEQRGLIHEYYTPSRVARAVAAALRPFLKELEDDDGTVKALEPSAGIGRFIRAMKGDGFEQLKWTAVEYSKVSARLLQMLRPDVEVYQGPFEEWIQSNFDRMGTYGLVASNPPYGERGKAAAIDRDQSYRYRQAYFYQMRRATECLKEGGVACFIVPYGFLSGTGKDFVDRRREILLSNHLMAAFRLPSEDERGKSLFPGALIVVDAVFLRSRGGMLQEVVEEDRGILEGKFFDEHPGYVLGREVGKSGDDEDVSKKPRFGFQVVGTFTGFPEFMERPLCRDCTVVRPARAVRERKPTLEVPEHLADALKMARRVNQYLTLVAASDELSLQRAADLQPDLRAALLAWNEEPAERKAAVAAGVKQFPELAALYSVFKAGALIAQIASAPEYKARFSGDITDYPAIAKYLFGQKREASLAAIDDYIKSNGGIPPAVETLKTALAAADFAFVDGGKAVVPPDVYYAGELWPRYDEARKAAAEGDPFAAAQAARLLKLIAPATFAEIQAEPRMGWLPVEVIGAFINYVLKTTAYDSADYSYVRVNGFLTLAGVDYLDLPLRATESQLLLLGYINHDMQYFKPRKGRSDDDTEERRVKMAEHIKNLFGQWIESRTDMQALITEAFNRRFRGWRTPAYATDNLNIARWNEQKPLFWYQNSGVRRLTSNHGGGLFFAVGLGKTRTVLATAGLARQQGWVHRPVIVVPNPVIYNWVREINLVLPDYSIGVIGSKTRRLVRGERKGELESETDTPAERAAKWQRFKAGLYDICLLTYSSLARTALREDSLTEIIRGSPALSREIGLRIRAVEERIIYLTKLKRLDEDQRKELETLAAKFAKLKPTERRQAIQAEREAEFVAEIRMLPEGQEHDPGIVWDELGIDFLCFDEAHNGKNLFTAGAREGGNPKFLGAPQQASALALQMFFRSAIVRRHTGGSGVYLADATPAKNSPLEFLSLTSFIDDKVWSRWGVSDAEQFLSQYLQIEFRNIIGTDLEPQKAPCVVGFRNLDQFREVLFRYGEFRDAKEVGLKIPRPQTTRLEVVLDEGQEAKYQAYLAQYEAALERSAFDEGSKFAALALLQRMSLVAIHGELDEPPAPAVNPLMARKEAKPQWTFKNAHQAASYSSPKIDIAAKTIAQRRDCGHLVFAENNAVHYWLRERLVDFGITRERIGILNGEVTPSNLARQRVAEGFTSVEAPLYDVVIANKIAYEGLNLQGRTCTIFHLDLPWEPATLTQRNGRGQRQGNPNEVISIFYVLAKASMDMARFQLIQGKREWMGAVLDSLATETNNPGAQQDMSPEDWLLWLSRDPEKTRALIDKQKAKLKQEEDEKTRKLAWASIRSIAVRHRDLRSADPVTQARLREDIESIGQDLEKVDSEVWTWKFIVPEVVRHPTLSFAPADFGAIWQTAKYKRKNFENKVIDTAEFGRVQYEPRLSIGYREEDSVYWQELEAHEAAKKWAVTSPADWQEPWEPFLGVIDASMQSFLRRLPDAPWHFGEARFHLAHEDFVVGIWDKYGKQITEAIASSQYLFQARLPIVKGGKLSSNEQDAKAGNEVLPFTDVGYQRFLAIAQISELKWTEVEAIAQWWWNRSIPRNLLTLRDQKLKAENKGAMYGEGRQEAQ